MSEEDCQVSLSTMVAGSDSQSLLAAIDEEIVNGMATSQRRLQEASPVVSGSAHPETPDTVPSVSGQSTESTPESASTDAVTGQHVDAKAASKITLQIKDNFDTYVVLNSSSRCNQLLDTKCWLLLAK
jgi:hypothetical protein